MDPYDRDAEEEDYWFEEENQEDYYDTDDRWLGYSAGEGLSVVYQPGYYDASGIWIPGKWRRAITPSEEALWLKKADRPDYYVDRWVPATIRRSNQRSSSDALWWDQSRERWVVPTKLYRVIDQGRGDHLLLNSLDHPSYYSAGDRRIQPKYRWAVRPTRGSAAYINRRIEPKYYTTTENWRTTSSYPEIQPVASGVTVGRELPTAIGKPIQRRLRGISTSQLKRRVV